VLEHIEAPTEFLRSIRRIAGGDRAKTATYFEVPNALFTLRDGGIWDILYEHCGYFTPASLARAFDLAGYAVESIEPTFGGQFLSLFGAISGRTTDLAAARERYEALFDAFATSYATQVKRESDFLAGERANGRKVVVWGAGTKGTMFLNTIIGRDGFVDSIVDINPRKWGKFVPGSGQKIVPPEAMDDARPDTVIVMNPAYADEIRDSLSARGLRPTMHVA
jgi:hypothetical protein